MIRLDKVEELRKKRLYDFCESYIQLAEKIILRREEEITLLDEEEKEVISKKRIGKCPDRFANSSIYDIKISYLTQKINLVKKIFDSSPHNVNNVLEEIRKLMDEAIVEINELKLIKSEKRLLDAKELYINYLIVCEAYKNLQIDFSKINK